MFRCTDCGQEYEVKPDYCDCGNDAFESIIPASEPSPQPMPQSTQPAPEIISQGGLILNVQQPRQTNSAWNTAEAAAAKDRGRKLKVDFVSLMIFLLCIVLSILSLIYIGKDSLEKIAQEENKQHDVKSALMPTANLPALDSFWNDTPPKPLPETVAKVEVLNNVKEPAPQTPVDVPVTAQKTQQVKPQSQNPQNVSKQQQIKQVQQTVKSPAKPTMQTSKPVQKAQTHQEKPTNQTQKTVQKPVQTAQKPVQTTPQQTTKPTTTTPAQPVQTVSPAVLKQEMDNYKVALGRKLSSGIDYRKIVGDGVCAVSFKIDTAGNLVSRKFVKQAADNDSLNNAVYKTIMNNPTYKSPPQGYKNETLTFTVSIYGGRFNVSLN